MSYRLKRLLKSAGREVHEARRMRRFRKELRSSDLFIVSYPKSGTHWVGFFLAAIVAERSGGSAESVTFRRWQEHAPLLGLMGPDSDRIREARSRPDPRIFLTHSPRLDCLPRVALLVRDPRDLFLSYFSHQRRVYPAFHGDERRFCLDLIRGRFWPGDWAEHVDGWLERPGPSPFVLRYEELKKDARAGFGRLLRYAGIEASPEQVERALRVSSFDRMKESERRDGMSGSDGDATVPFMRKGSATSWRDDLRPDLLAAIEFAWGDTMGRLGYTPSAGPVPGEPEETFEGKR